MQALIEDVRYSLKTLARSVRLMAIATASLALGLGANIAIFSVVYAVLLYPLPYREPERLVLIWESTPQKGIPLAPISPANFADFREQARAFESMACYERANLALTGAGEPEQLRGLRVSHDFFATLAPALGRGFLAAETEPGREEAVVVSHGLWERRFGRDPMLLGRTLILNGQSRTVVGIMPRGFAFPDRGVEVWLPLGFSPQDVQQRGYRRLGGIARLKRGLDQDRAAAELNYIAERLEQQYPVSNRGWRTRLVPVREQPGVEEVRPALIILLGTVGLVLLIGCANIASLLLARNAARDKELAIRAALGAGRGRILQQLLLESVLLALLGGALGLMLQPWLTRLLLSLGPKGFVLPERVDLDGAVVAFGLGATLLTALLSGLIPALQASRTNLVESLKEGGRSATAGALRRRARNCLVVAEVAVALVLLAGAGVMLQSFLRLRAVDPGYRIEHVLTVRLGLQPSRYGEARQKTAFQRALLERVRTLPGVEAAAVTNHLPTVSDFARAFTIGGRPVPPPGEWPVARFRAVTPEYFRAMGIPVLHGRAFTVQDHGEAPGVALINQTLARQHWPQQDPLGQRINLEKPERQHAWRVVVGVVGDVRHRGLDAEVQPEVYVPYDQVPEASVTLVLRTAIEPSRLAAPARAAVRAVDPDQPVGEVRTLEQVVAESDSVGSRRTVLLLLIAFAALAVLLAAVGVYGVISYSVAQRTQEIGVRMALGASSADLVRMVVRQALALALAGIALGTAGALALSRFLTALVYQVKPADPGTYAAVALLLMTVALAASYLPARLATRVSPVTALRGA